MKSSTFAAVLLLVSAVSIWVLSRLTWADLTAVNDKTLPRNYVVTGATWAPALVPTALVLLAAVVAIFAVKGWGMRILAVLLAAVSLLAMYPALSLINGQDQRAYAEKIAGVPPGIRVVDIEIKNWPVYLTLMAALPALVACVLLFRSAVRATGLSDRYQGPAARRASLEKKVFAGRTHPQSELTKENSVESVDNQAKYVNESLDDRQIWDALDAGNDPTLDSIEPKLDSDDSATVDPASEEANSQG